MKLFFLFLLLISTSAAQSTTLHDWTSNDQRTIQARFIGAGAHSVLIEKDGTVFTVPFSRLAPQSIEQARRLGGSIVNEGAKTALKAPVVLETARVPVSVLAKPVTAPRHSLPGITAMPSTQPCMLSLQGKTATPTGEVPYTVQRAIEAGNFLQTKPYVWGGGHGSVIAHGYDCSGSVSYVLIQAGLLSRPLTSGSFARYGEPGPGKWISIHAGPGHVFMTVCGLRLDTGGRGGRGESGPRWCSNPRYGSRWTVRHPPGF